MVFKACQIKSLLLGAMRAAAAARRVVNTYRKRLANHHRAAETACSSDQINTSADDLQKMSATPEEIVGRFKI